jgi:glycine/serine hydroxymethyltransferase
METSGIRIGTAAETTRGHDEVWFGQLAVRIVQALK